MKRRTFLKIAGMFVLVGPTLRLGEAWGQRPFRPVLIWDPARCLGCRACMAACQMSHGFPYQLLVLEITSLTQGQYPHAKVSFQEQVCKQCRQASCIKVCPSHALKRTPEGVVTIDHGLCLGDGLCVEACKQKGIKLFNAQAYKCDFCLEFLRLGEVPRCVAVCPSGALIFGDLYAPQGSLAQVLAQSAALKKALEAYQEIVLGEGVKIHPFERPQNARIAPSKRGDRVTTTVCLACNARCGLRVWTRGEKLSWVEGNPYHPYNRAGNSIAYATPWEKSLYETAGICAKPLFDQDYLDNPYRLRVPLKRNGPRGSGKFRPISWETLIREIAQGGQLFLDLGDSRYYPGLKDVLSDEPIDPHAPELGPQRNQFVCLTGRTQGGRKEFIKRFVNQAVGSINCIGHTDICGLGFRMGNFAFSNGRQVEFKADFWKSRYVLVFGANLYAALQPGPPTSGSVLAERAAAKEVKFVIIDPRAHEATNAAAEWIPVRPGKDGALALGFLRVLLEEDLYDKEFLCLPNLKAAQKKGRNVFTNATHLVVVEGPQAGRFLLSEDLKGINTSCPTPLAVDLKGTVQAAEDLSEALLLWEGEIQGFKVKTAFKLFTESVFEHSLDFYAQESGVPKETIVRVARQFAKYAPFSAAFAYHGGGNYVGGTYASYAIALLNALVGNVNREGGYLCSGGGAAPWRRGLYDLKAFPGAKKAQGIKISREKARYEGTNLYKKDGYPAKLPWFPFTKGGLSVSALAGIDQAYPYPIKVLFTYFFNPVYTAPGGRRFEETLKDPQKVPLHVSIDVTINETNLYADYIVPDVTYLEGHYGFLTPHAPAQRFTAVRTPVFKPRTLATSDGRPFCLETFLIDLAQYLALPGFGQEAIKAQNGLLPLQRAEDFYLRGLANLAFNAKVPKASAEEKKLVEKNYLVAEFKHLLSPEEWSRVCTVLCRGGVFFPPETVFDARGNLKKGINLVCFWNEKLALATNGLSSQRFWGTVKYQRVLDSSGQSIEELDAEFPLVLVSHKTALHTQSRTICYRQALQYQGEPVLLINPEDARSLGLHDGEPIEISSRENPLGVKAKVKISPAVRPGVAVYPFHYGHTQHGASKLEIIKAREVLLGGREVASGAVVLPDPKRRVGINPNVFSRRDPHLFHLPLLDLVGGIPDFSSTRIQIKRLNT